MFWVQTAPTFARTCAHLAATDGLDEVMTTPN
jgi:hypothetical protein